MEEQTIKLLNKTFTLAAILVVGVLVFFAGQMFYQSKIVDQQITDQITVSGEGKVYVKPDIALVSLGVKTTGATTADVISRNTEKMNAVIKAVKDLGVEEKDIQTTSYNLYPEYNWTEAAGRIFQGYVLEQNLQVKIRNFDKAGDILQQAVAKGANLTSNLQFTIEEPEKFRQEAREKAIKIAKEKAQNLASASGIRLGKIVNIYENYAYPMYNSAKDLGMGSPESAPAPVIQPGQTEINVTINLVYRIN